MMKRRVNMRICEILETYPADYLTIISSDYLKSVRYNVAEDLEKVDMVSDIESDVWGFCPEISDLTVMDVNNQFFN